MITGNALWALAPQYAERIFASINEEISAGEQRGIKSVSDSKDFGSMITRHEKSTAVISIHGALDQETRLSIFSGNIYTLGYDAIRSAINSALSDPLADSILLSIDSPGGSVAGAKELADFIAEAEKIKPVAAYADGLCASAAFWLASATGNIYAPATALVGSIGVIMCFADWSAWYAKMGVKMEYIASGKFKAAGRDGKELTGDERKYFEEQMGEIHSIFKNDVRSALSLDADESLWAEAQLMSAARALEIGLVSHVVRDESEAIKILSGSTRSKENVMSYTLDALQKNAPELLASIRDEAYEKGKKEGLESGSANSDNSVALSVIRLVCDKEDAEVCEKLIAEASELNLSAKQITAFAAIFKSGAKSGSASAAESSANSQDKTRLEAIISAHKPPVNSDSVQTQTKSRLLADAERRAGGNS